MSAFWGSYVTSCLAVDFVGELGGFEPVDDVRIDAVSDEKVAEVVMVGDIGIPLELGPMDLLAIVPLVVERVFVE
jgi:hypothetical protein